MRISEISLQGVLPQVFSGDTPRKSDVWSTTLTFTRPNHYLVAAESGAGKSSMCSFIYGNRSDYSGTITFDNQPIRSFSLSKWCEIRRQHIALLPQELRLFGELTAFENIQIKNRLTDFKSESEIRRMLAMLEIEHKADTPAAKLSVGQQQRVALVRALCQPFDFLLLDEPVSHLDRRNNTIAAELVCEEAHRQQAAIISTSVGNHLLLPSHITLSL